MTGRILCGYPLDSDVRGEGVICRNTAPCPVHRDLLALAADIPASNPAPGLFEQVTGTPYRPNYPAYVCDHAESLYGRCVACGKTWEEQAAARALPVDPADPGGPHDAPPVDYRPLLVDDEHDWSVRRRLAATLGRPALATRLADALTPQLGAELADRLDTLVNQARSEAVVELENQISEGIVQARERLDAEADELRRAVHDERYRGNSRLS